jgi:hypothetical protein
VADLLVPVAARRHAATRREAAEAQIDSALRRAPEAAWKAPFVPGALVEHHLAPHVEPGSVAGPVPLGLGALGLGAAAVMDDRRR